MTNNYRSLFFILSLVLSSALGARDLSSASFEVAPELKSLEKKVISTVEKTKDSVIAIIMKDGSGQTVGSGSGVIVSEKGLIYTAAHVVDGFEDVYAIMSDESEHKVRVLGMNCYKDAAVCRMLDTSRTYPYAEPGDSDQLKVTDWVIAMGHARGYDKTRTAPVRFGRVRAHNPGRYLTTDCPLIGGDSGGPLFDLDGKVVGINSSINGLAKFNVHAGVSGFTDDLTRLKSSERWGTLLPNVLYTPETPLLGVNFPKNNTPYYKNRRIRYTAHLIPARISDVSEGGPADQAGLQGGDLIRVIADEEIATRQDLEIALGRQKVGDKVKVVVQRGKRLLETEVVLAKRESAEEESISAPPISENEDSPYVKSTDKPKLQKQVVELFSSASALEGAKGDTYIQLYYRQDITTPILNATIIKDGMAIAPLSTFETLPEEIFAWRPGGDAMPVRLLGGYEEHDLAVLDIAGLEAPQDLLSQTREVKLGEFLCALSSFNNAPGIIKMGVVSVEKRNLTGRIGVMIGDHPDEDGVIVEYVAPNRTAFNMGIRRGTIIKTVNDVAIKTAMDLKSAIDSLKVGDKIKIDFVRKGKRMSEESILGGKGSDGARIDMMDQLGKNSLSKNRDSFQTVIQSDMLVEPKECGSPIFTLDGGFAGIAISDAGRNKTYILPAGSIKEALEEAPRPLKKAVKVSRAEPRSQPSMIPPRQRGGIIPRSGDSNFDSIFEQQRRRQQEIFERLFREPSGSSNSDSDALDDIRRLRDKFYKDFFEK